MIEPARATRVRAAAWLLAGVSGAIAAAPAPCLAAPAARTTEYTMAEGEISIRETTQPELSGHLVGVSNIWQRDLPDANGAIAPQASAQVSIFSVDTRERRTEIVRPGSVLVLGADRYQVQGIVEGQSAPGWIVLRKIAR